MRVFLWKGTFCLTAGGAATALFFGGFVIGYRGGYEQALRDVQQRFPTLVPSQPPTPEWSEFLNSPPPLPWLGRGPATIP